MYTCEDILHGGCMSEKFGWVHRDCSYQLHMSLWIVINREDSYAYIYSSTGLTTWAQKYTHTRSLTRPAHCMRLDIALPCIQQTLLNYDHSPKCWSKQHSRHTMHELQLECIHSLLPLIALRLQRDELCQDSINTFLQYILNQSAVMQCTDMPRQSTMKDFIYMTMQPLGIALQHWPSWHDL